MSKILVGTVIGWVIFVNQLWLFESVMGNFFSIIIVFFIANVVLTKIRKNRQKKFIENYCFPEELNEKILAVYPHLLKKYLTYVKQELKLFFKMNSTYRSGIISMPSRIVDVVWHEFILHTRDYHNFCQQGFGYYFHHNPFSKETASQDIKLSLQRAWLYSCKAENIDPKNPHCLPALFSIDSSLNISDGNKFSVENTDGLTRNDSSNSNGSLKCMRGSFVGVGAVVLISSVDAGSDGGADGGGGCGGCGG